MATEIINERLLYPSYEIIGGKKVMAPAPNPTHGRVIGRLYKFIDNYFDENEGGCVFADNTDVHFLDGTTLKPDLSVVTEKNSAIVDWLRGIYGVPDMVVEVLSKSTRKKDLTIKKDIYEAQGVKEYWIIDPYMKAISVYLLQDGKYFLDDEYILFDAADLDLLTDAEKADVKHEVPVHTLDDLKIPLNFIFKWGYR
ncbi:MAG: Uma2 family endonuclease [Selenomonadaceae bacterium]|nr:Uma2 family endonuclease [Selenomonadaceae bacterium]